MSVTDRAGEVMTATSGGDALALTQIHAMRTMSDNMAMMSRQLERLADDAKVTREGVIELKAQDLKATILEVRREALAAVERLREDHEKRLDEVGRATQANELATARLRGNFMPLVAAISTVAAAILAFVGEFLANALTGGVGPHHP